MKKLIIVLLSNVLISGYTFASENTEFNDTMQTENVNSEVKEETQNNSLFASQHDLTVNNQDTFVENKTEETRVINNDVNYDETPPVCLKLATEGDKQDFETVFEEILEKRPKVVIDMLALSNGILSRQNDALANENRELLEIINSEEFSFSKMFKRICAVHPEKAAIFFSIFGISLVTTIITFLKKTVFRSKSIKNNAPSYQSITREDIEYLLK